MRARMRSFGRVGCYIRWMVETRVFVYDLLRRLEGPNRSARGVMFGRVLSEVSIYF